MGIVFLIALPILVWLLLVTLKTKSNADKVKRRNDRKVLIEPLFSGRYADFFYALSINQRSKAQIDFAKANKWGRLIMTYIAHNPSEAAIFMEGISRIKTISPELSIAENALHQEVATGDLNLVHLISYRAIQTLKRQNPNLNDFNPLFDFQIAASMQMILAFNRPKGDYSPD